MSKRGRAEVVEHPPVVVGSVVIADLEARGRELMRQDWVDFEEKALGDPEDQLQ